jgi:allophanate hydrolase subunit 1
VEVILLADNSVSVAEFGHIYEAITSNRTLTVFYQPNAIETNLLNIYLKQKESNKVPEVTR